MPDDAVTGRPEGGGVLLRGAAAPGHRNRLRQRLAAELDLWHAEQDVDPPPPGTAARARLDAWDRARQARVAALARALDPAAPVGVPCPAGETPCERDRNEGPRS